MANIDLTTYRKDELAERDDNQTAIDELNAENAALRKQLAQVRAIVK